MTRHLHVLVAESHPGLASHDVATMEAAGHVVHRCYEPDQRGFPCVAVDGEPCPLEGAIDVAFLHRLPMTPRATPLEDGIRCAVRQGVPVVEAAPSMLDPFEPFVSSYVGEDGDLLATLEEAATGRFDPLRLDVLRRIGPLLHGAGIPMDHVSCRIEPRSLDLDIHLTVDAPEDRGFDQSIAVRALDAVRAAGRSFGHVDVHVHHRTD